MADRNFQSVLMYHGVGKADHPYEPGEEEYWISRQAFTSSLDACATFAPTEYLLTFDDGNASDLEAAHEMARRGYTGIFFVLVGRIGHPGYLSRDNIREMLGLGMEIGSHGRDHVDWRRIGDDHLAREVNESGIELADLCGAEIRSVAIPYGAYDRRVRKFLDKSPYARIFTSDRGLSDRCDRFVRRNPIMAWHDKADIEKLIRNEVSPIVKIRRVVASGVKRFI